VSRVPITFVKQDIRELILIMLMKINIGTAIIVSFCFLLFSCNQNENGNIQIAENAINIFTSTDGRISDTIANNLFIQSLELIKQKNFVAAKTFLLKADSIEKDNVIIVNALAETAYNLNKRAEAFKLYERSLAIDSNFWVTYSNYAGMLKQCGEYEKAISLLNKGRSNFKTSKQRTHFYYALSSSYYYLRRCDSADIYIDSAMYYVKDAELKDHYLNCKKHLRKC
jgi:tetratricopeptide (TPR) repeat protein